ncbi:hypothetical protein JCM10213_004495 [Rhodosporidiobolus nylandii]
MLRLLPRPALRLARHPLFLPSTPAGLRVQLVDPVHLQDPSPCSQPKKTWRALGVSDTLVLIVDLNPAQLDDLAATEDRISALAGV